MQENTIVFQLMGLDDAVKQEIIKAEPLVAKNLDAILERFYDTVTKFPEMASLFSSPERVTHARVAQKAHWLKLFSGKFDSDYIASIRKIGSVHYAVGLPPEPYMAAYTRVISELIEIIAQAHKSKGINRTDVKRMAQQQSAVVKAALFDMHMAVSVYLQEERTAKVIALTRMADTVEDDAGNAVEIVANKTIEMSQRASEMARSATDVGNDCQTVANASSIALENAETVAAATEQLSISISEIASQIASASQITGSAVTSATQSRDTITRLSSAVDRIDQVAKLINDIAAQTNLLALNATIEAARGWRCGQRLRCRRQRSQKPSQSNRQSH